MKQYAIIAYLIVTAALGYTIYLYRTEQAQYLEQKKKSFQQEARTVADVLENDFKMIQEAVRPLAQSLSHQDMDQETLKKAFNEQLKKNRQIAGIGIAYLPHKHDPQLRLFAPYYVQHAATSIDLGSRSDYTREHWFDKAIASTEGIWVGPIKSPQNSVQIFRYEVPFFYTDATTHVAKPMGILFYDIELTTITKELSVESLEYGFVLAANGSFIGHTDPRFIESNKKLTEFPFTLDQKIWKSIADRAIKGERNTQVVIDSEKKATFLLTYEPIASIGGFVGVATQLQYTTQAYAHFKNIFFILTLLATTWLLLSLSFVLRVYTLSVLSLWLFSGAFSLIFGALIVMQWTFFANVEDRQIERPHVVPLYNKEERDRFIALNEKLRGVTSDQDILIPTGIFITDYTITPQGSTINLEGFVWQYFDAQVLGAGIKPLIRFSNASKDVLQEVYTIEQKSGTLIGWKFSGDFKQTLNMANYPLDRHAIVVGLSSYNLDKSPLLMPDFDSWQSTDTKNIDIITKNLDDAWTNKEAFFYYTVTHFPTNLGIKNFKAQNNFPELHYNFIVQRKFLTTLLVKLVPIFSILFILFLFLLFSTGPEMSVVFIISSISGFILTTVLSQQQLRSALAPDTGITYLEYFFFVIYIIIVLTAVTTLLYKYNAKIAVFQYKQNLITRLLYWPTVSFLFWLVTLSFFY